MAKLPDVQDLGPRPTPESRRQVATVRNADAVGSAAARLGETASAALERLEDFHDESNVRALDARHDERAREIRARALEARGEAAAQARATADEEITRLNGEILGAARSNRARSMLERIVASRSGAERDTIQRHSTNEVTQFMDGQFVARRDQYIRRAQEAWDDPARADEAMLVARNEVAGRGQWRGWSREQTEAEQAATVSAIRSGIAERMVSAGNYDGALAYIEQHRAEIDHQSENALRVAIRGPMLEVEADRLVDGVLSSAQAPAAPQGNDDQAPAPNLIARMVSITAQSESGNRERDDRGRLVTSPAGAQGRMQVMPNTARNPGYGIRPWDGRTDEDRSRVGRELLAALMQRHGGNAAMAWASYNWDSSGTRVDRLVERYGGRWLDHAPAETRAYVRQNIAALGNAAPASDVAMVDGRIDYAAARVRIDGMNLSPDLRRAAMTALDRRISVENATFSREANAVQTEITQRLTEIQANGGRLTSITQIPADLVARAQRYSPQTVLQLQSSIEANNRPTEPEANSPLATQLRLMAAENPNGFVRENIELYRGRITDAEVEQLVMAQSGIRTRSGPHPNDVLAAIRFVLPETGIIPAVDPEGDTEERRTQASAAQAARHRAEASLLAAVTRRLQLTYGQAEVTPTQIMAAARAEVTMTTLNGQAMPIYQARERGASQFPVNVPSLAVPYIDDRIRRAGLPVTSNNRVQFYLNDRDAIDRAVNRGRSAVGTID